MDDDDDDVHSINFLVLAFRILTQPDTDNFLTAAQTDTMKKLQYNVFIIADTVNQLRKKHHEGLWLWHIEISRGIVYKMFVFFLRIFVALKHQTCCW